MHFKVEELILQLFQPYSYLGLPKITYFEYGSFRMYFCKKQNEERLVVSLNVKILIISQNLKRCIYDKFNLQNLYSVFFPVFFQSKKIGSFIKVKFCLQSGYLLETF